MKIQAVNVKDDSKLSYDTKYMLKTGIGYCTDYEFPPDYDDTLYVMKHEIIDLGYETMPETLALVQGKKELGKFELIKYLNQIAKDYPYAIRMSSELEQTNWYDSYDMTIYKYAIDGKAVLLDDLDEQGMILALPKPAGDFLLEEIPIKEEWYWY